MRRAIYRNICCIDEETCYLWRGLQPGFRFVPRPDFFSLNPFLRYLSLLQVSHQIHDEAISVLYGETTFRLVISETWSIDYGVKPKWTFFGAKPSIPIHKIQRLHIKIQVQTNTNIGPLLDPVREINLAMAESTSLKHLTVQLQNWGMPASGVCTMLQPFGMLRGLESVNFQEPLPEQRATWTGAPPDFVRHLKSLMQEPMPPEYLPRMFPELRILAKPFLESSLETGKLMQDLSEAYKAAEDGNEEKFKMAQQEIIAQIS